MSKKLESGVYPKSCPLGETDRRTLLDMEATGEGWRLIKKSPNCTVYAKDDGSRAGESGKKSSGGIQVFKGQLKLPKLRFFQALEYICKIEISNRWNPAFTELTVLEEKKDYKIVHGYVQMPPKTEKRDVVRAEVVDFFDPDSGAVLVMWKSCGFENEVPSYAQIRVQEGLSGIIVRADDKSTKITFIIQVDFKGSLSTQETQEIIARLMIEYEKSIMEYHNSTLGELKEFYSAAQPNN